MKKHSYSTFFKVTAASAVVASIVVPVQATEQAMSDVPASHQFFDAVQELQSRGIISGYTDGTFKPENNLTRGQAAKIIAGVLNLDTTNVKNPNFKDIPTTHQYYGAIAALKQANIIDGFEDGTFKPGDNVQRNHVAKILANAMNLKATNSANLPLTDVRENYKEAIAALYENGVTKGKTATTFDGGSSVTRGQMAAFIIRAENATKAAQQTELTKTTETVKTTEKTSTNNESVVFTVGNYTTNAITINGTSYTYASDVKAIFNESNKVALAGATMTATINNGVITKVTDVTLNQSGSTKNPLTFSAKATINQLTINADYVEVKDIHVTGDVFITNAASTATTLNKVKIDKQIIVTESTYKAASLQPTFAKNATKPTITLKNTTVSGITIKRDSKIDADNTIPTVTITGATAVDLDATITTLLAQTTNNLTLAGNAKITDFAITTPTISLQLKGTIEAIALENAKTKVTLGKDVLIKKFTLPNKTLKIANVIENYKNVSKQIERVVNKSSSGGGGGGGSTTTTTNVFKSSTASINNTIDILGIKGTDVHSSKKSVATVELKNGKIVITSEKEGEATITVSDGAKEAIINVTVDDDGDIKTTIKKYSPIVFEKTTSIDNTIETLGMKGTDVQSSMKSVATVELKNGKIVITSKKEGTAAITVSDGTKQALIHVIVDKDGNIKTTIEKYSRFVSEATASTNNTVKTSVHPRWASPIKDFIFDNDDDTFSTLEVNEQITIKTYDANYKKLSEKTLALELPVFGAFYSGETYNYIAYGQNNPNEENIEVIRIVKYDKNFNRIGAASVNGNEAYATKPFDASSGGKMAEQDDTLTFHTSRERYKSSDGLNHQSQLTIEINTNTMKATNTLGSSQWNHVSHSFDQYVLMDNERPVYLDHGDAYPRSLVLHKAPSDSFNPSKTKLDVEFFKINGETGANVTGASIGGFEQSNDRYLVAFNSINQNNTYTYTSHELQGGDVNKRNIFLYGVEKDFASTSDSAIIKTTIANYENTSTYTTTPTFVKITNDKFAVLWQEYSQNHTIGSLKYVYVDGQGQPISSTYTATDMVLSTVQPIVKNNKIIWYTTSNKKKVMYELEIE